MLPAIYWRTAQPTALVDVSQVPEMNELKITSGGLVCGASVVINQLIQVLLASSSKMFNGIANHLKKVASLPVRNVSVCIFHSLVGCFKSVFRSGIVTGWFINCGICVKHTHFIGYIYIYILV